MNHRLELAPRHSHITRKVRIANQRTLDISVHDDLSPAEIFFRVKGPDCTPELIGLYDVSARLTSVALQYGAIIPRKARRSPHRRQICPMRACVRA